MEPWPQQRVFRAGISADKSVHFTALADALTVSAAANAAETWRDLRRVNPKTKKKFGTSPVQALVDKDGNVAHNFAEIRKCWHDHFSAVESAVDVSLSDLFADVRAGQDEIRGTFDVDPWVGPTIPEMEHAFRQAKGSRSA